MTPEKHDDDLAYEQSVNERYLRQVESSANDAWRGLDTVAAPANTGWTGDGPKKPRPKGPAIPLIGRVALATDDEELGRSFYVGGGFTPLSDGITVVSWAAEAARLFYEGRNTRVGGSEGIDPQSVVARRSFEQQALCLVDFEDDCEPDVDPRFAFEQPSRLAILPPPASPGQHEASGAGRIRPAADRTVDRDRLPPADEALPTKSHGGNEAPSKPPMRDPSAERHHMPPGTVDDTTTTAEASEPTDFRPHRPPGTAEDTAPGISAPQASAADLTRDTGERKPRVPRLLSAAIEAPKTGELASVLSTLQPEQYRLVTWSLEENLVVQGHPGTGKTIVAAHRAAYLVLPKDDDGKKPRLHRVALVGPTDRWRKHITPTVVQLVEKGVEVLSLESLIRAWAGSSRRDVHPKNEREIHSGWAIGRVVDRAANAEDHRLRRLTHAMRVKELVNSLIQDTEVHRKCLQDESRDLSDWLLEAGDINQIRRDPSYLPFLAAAGIAAGGIGQHGGHQHIIVDEAQDLRPIEWWMLSKMFREASQARWSLLGDMNQRRSDFTWQTWDELVGRLELSGDAEGPLLPEMLDSGYRSTREILDYAGALLPRGMRKHSALRRGPEPLVRLVGPGQVTDKSREEAERLTGRYSQGSVAVIAWGPDKVNRIEQAFRKGGWRKDSGGEWFQRPSHDCRLIVARPVLARGLEFDAVVVVEPADFKPNLGRHGELYTSLTRANHELVVIHSKAIPRELRGRGNRVRG